MRALKAMPLVLLAVTAWADPSGKRWATPPIAFFVGSSVGNRGVTSITGGVPYSTVLSRTQAAFRSSRSWLSSCRAALSFSSAMAPR